MPRSPKPSKLSASLTLASTLILTSCAHQIPTAATSPPPICPVAAPLPPPLPSACVAFPRLSFSRLHDTDETIRGVKAYDAARDALCGVGK